MNLNEPMARLGHLATRKQLGALAIRRHTIDQALHDGTLLHVRPGWVATPQANQLAVRAVLEGARLTGATALRSHGVWSGRDLRLHLQVPANAHRVAQTPLTPISAFTPPVFSAHYTVKHWAHATPQSAEHPAWRVSITDALVRFARTESNEQLAAAIESAVHIGLLSRRDVTTLFLHLPGRLGLLKKRLTFQAESGLETVARMRFEEEGYSLAQQVEIGPDRVDIVIDGWLVVELDGDEWHDPVKDRIRTNRLIRAGYRVLRFGYVEVFEQWTNTVATVNEMLMESAPVASARKSRPEGRKKFGNSTL